MLGLGWTEMLVVGVVALIVIGPKDLPVVMNRIGKFAGMVRRMGNEFQREINRSTGLDEVRSLRNSITAPLKQTTEEIRREFNSMSSGGAVKPSGLMKPADPKAESVVAEIHKAAGLPPPEAEAIPTSVRAEDGAAGVSSPAPEAKPVRVRAKRPARLAPVATGEVSAGPLPDVSPDVSLETTPAKRLRGGRVKVFTPAPGLSGPENAQAPESLAPAKRVRARRKATEESATLPGKPE